MYQSTFGVFPVVETPYSRLGTQYLRGFTFPENHYHSVKKTELVHLHALLVLLSERVVEQGIVDRSYFDPYRALSVTPVSFRARRDRHEEAVLLLAALLAAAVSDDREPPDTVDQLRADPESSTSSQS